MLIYLSIHICVYVCMFVCSNIKKCGIFNPCECLAEEWKCLPPPRHEWQTKVRSEAPPGHMPPQSAPFTRKEKTMFYVCMYVCMYAYMCVCVWMYVHVPKCMYVCMWKLKLRRRSSTESKKLINRVQIIQWSSKDSQRIQ